MPSWKKLITSGSAASLSSITTSGDITIPVTNKVYLDGGGDSYISTTTESSNNNISFVIGGNTRVKMLPHIMYINSTGPNGLVINNDEGTTTNSGRIFFEGNSTSVIFQEADDLSFRTGGTAGSSSGTERFRVNTSGVAVTGDIDASGALTLGTALAVAEGGTGATSLTSNGILTGNGTSAIQAESNLLFNGSTLEINNTGDWSYVLNNTNSGGLRFGTKDSGGTLAYQIEISNTGNYVKLNENTTVTGDLNATGDVVAFYSSDKRLKDNIVRIENPLEKVEKIGGYTFDWNDKQETYIGKDVGVIAQEIQEVLPELVTERDNGYLAVKYEKIVPLLIESIKELKQEVDEIKQKCDCLNN